MQKHVLMLTASTFILAWGAIAASAQSVPDVPTIQQQPQILQQRQEPYARAVATVDIAELALEIGFLAGHYAVADDEREWRQHHQ